MAHAAARRSAGVSLVLLLASGFVASIAAQQQEQQLALARPEGDCLAPAIRQLTQSYNFYPSSYQLQSLLAPSAASSSGLSTTVEFAADFSVTYYGTYKVVNNSRARETYLLYQCGTPNPAAPGSTEAALPPGTKVFEIPLVSVAVTDSNAAAFLAELGLVDRVAFASQYSFNACLQAVHACGGNAVSPSNDSTSEWEQLAAAQQPRVDAIFTGDASANAKSIAVTAYSDPGVLNRAEWVKFVAVFFNKEVEANRLFGGIVDAYAALNASARAEAAAAAAQPTSAAWISKFGDALTVSYATFKVQCVADAGGVMPGAASVAAAGGVASPSGGGGGGNYVFNASVPAQQAAFMDILQGVDVIFDESFAPASGNLLDLPAFTAAYGPGAASLPAVAAGRVYAFNNRLSKGADNSVGSDWFETSVARPDLVLRDFVKVLTPAAAPADATLTWLRQLPATNVSAASGLSFTTAAACSAISTAANAADRCSRPEPARICPNAFRDCTTGELRTVTDPSQRCSARTVCAEPTPVAVAAPATPSTPSMAAAPAPRNAASAAPLASLATRVSVALGAMLLAAALL